MQKKQNKHSKKSGFTLIEIILVVVIIGILSVVFLKGLNLQGKSEMARVTAAQADIVTLSAALDMYEMMNGTYPENLDGLMDSSKQGFPFLNQNALPKTPWQKAYEYSQPGSHNPHRFDIWCESLTGKTIGNWPSDDDSAE